MLEERELDYRIKEFETTRYIEDSDGNKKKKKYKNAWKIVRFNLIFLTPFFKRTLYYKLHAQKWGVKIMKMNRKNPKRDR